MPNVSISLRSMRRGSHSSHQNRSKPGVPCFHRGCAFTLALLFIALFFLPERAFCQAVDMALVLVIDTSGSIDESEYKLQFGGYAAAFRDPAAIEAMTSGPNKAIAVDVLVFSDSVTRIMGWEIIHDKASSLRVADLLENAPRVQIGGTFLAQAIKAAIMELTDCPFIPAVSTIDVSGDGPDNEGLPINIDVIDLLKVLTGRQPAQWSQQLDNNAYRLRELRDHVHHQGININCVAIEDPGMKTYFKKNVMSGSASFTLFASSFRTFATVIQKKILREIQAGIKFSISKEISSKAQSLDNSAPLPGGDVETKEREKRTVSNAGTNDAVEKKPLPQGEMKADEHSGEKSMSFTAPANVSRKIRFVVRDSDSRLPLNEIKISSASANSLSDVEDVAGCPGQMLATVGLKEGQPVELTISAAGYEAKALTVSKDTPDRCEILLSRLPMKIIW